MHHELGLHREREDDRQNLHDHPWRSEPETQLRFSVQDLPVGHSYGDYFVKES